jgi:predicted Ser/Thr protein kinase
MMQSGVVEKGQATPSSFADWQRVATTLAMQGQLNSAADIHLQGGDINEAVTCLADAGLARQAALIAMGGGDYAKAAELLVDQIDQGQGQAVAPLLGQLLVNLSEFHLAEQLLRTRLAPTIDESNAPIVYQFARMMEDAGALEEAARLYGDLLGAGARSPEVEERLGALRAKLQSGLPQPEYPRDGTNPGLLNSTIRRKMSAADFLSAAIADSDDAVPLPQMPPSAPPPIADSQTAKPFQTATTASKGFPFQPAAPKEKPSSALVSKPRETTGPTTPRHQLSLLGSAAIEAAGGEATVGQGIDPFRIEQRYRIDREIGKGGMGVVYQAHDLLLDRPIALKVLKSFGSDPSTIRQFLLEARAIARLSHPNIIRVFDMGVIDVQHYIAMEFVTGRDLRAHIAEKGQLPLREALRLFLQIAEGLASAHAAGIVHRDVKPANILLTNELDVRIVDFGLAKLHRPDGHDGEETTFRSAGTPGYMSPEQIRGDSVTPAADIYALGITLFHMLVGLPPHRHAGITGSEQIIVFQMTQEMPSLREARPDVPPAIDQLYRYCTMREKSERFQDVSQFLATTRQWMESL